MKKNKEKGKKVVVIVSFSPYEIRFLGSFLNPGLKPLPGFEPGTSCLPSMRSTAEL